MIDKQKLYTIKVYNPVFWDDSHVESPVIEQGLLYFWQKSRSSKYCHRKYRKRACWDRTDFLSLALGSVELLTSDNTLAERPEEEPHCTTRKQCHSLTIQHFCNGILTFTIGYWILCWPCLDSVSTFVGYRERGSVKWQRNKDNRSQKDETGIQLCHLPAVWLWKSYCNSTVSMGNRHFLVQYPKVFSFSLAHNMVAEPSGSQSKI